MNRIESWSRGPATTPVVAAIPTSLDDIERFRASRTLTADAEAVARLKVAKVSTALDLFDRLDRARRHIHAHLGRTVSLRELGALASLSTFHFARFFRLAFGSAPIAYHRALRLERAAALLLSGGLSVADVAELAGYSDAAAFSHAFRRHFGVSPRRLVASA